MVHNKAIKAFHGNPAAYVVPNSEEEASAINTAVTQA
jgi:hypothetical protein